MTGANCFGFLVQPSLPCQLSDSQVLEVAEVWVPDRLRACLHVPALLRELRASAPLCLGQLLHARRLRVTQGEVGTGRLHLTWRSWPELLTELLRRAPRAATEEGLWREAASLAAEVHAGQTRVDGMPYILHPLEVAGELERNWEGTPAPPAELIAAALLHDVVEDGNLSSRQLADRFGARVAELVDLVSVKVSHGPKGPGRDAAYFGPLLADPAAGQLKCADLACNTGTLHLLPDDRHRRQLTGKYYPQLETWVVPWAERQALTRWAERFRSWLRSPLTLLDLHHSRQVSPVPATSC